MNPRETLAYLDGLGGELRPGHSFSLDPMQTLAAALGQPQRAFASLHVAGTNGKGSVCALAESAARLAGWRTGLYTSPHLERLQERIQIAGALIGDEPLARAATRVRAAAEAAGLRLSFFEAMTAIAFQAFAEAGVELAVVEVGLGGRLDSTNILAPQVAAITAIGMDHEAYLGDTLAAIAAEKAGILKPGLRAAVSAPQAPEVAAVLQAQAARAGVPLHPIAPDEIDRAPPTALLGHHQRQNAAVAARACAELGRAGWPIPAAAVRAGFAAARWPGRLEKIADHPEVFLDGAHNPLAARALGAFLDSYRRHHPAPVLIYGSMRDKAVGEICEVLFPRAAAVVATAPHHARALAPEAITAACGAWAPRIATAPDYASALRRARDWSAGVAPIFVTGSLYLVAEARAQALPAPHHRPA